MTMARRAATSFLGDFKAFINKGNVVDLAVAVVIGGAFGKVVDAIVSLVMTNALEPALKAAKVSSISAWPAGTVIVALINFLLPARERQGPFFLKGTHPLAGMDALEGFISARIWSHGMEGSEIERSPGLLSLRAVGTADR
jgi:hypothetical protein